MKKFLSVLTAIAFISAIPFSAEARGFQRQHHRNPRPQHVVVNNYNYGHHGYNHHSNSRGRTNVYYITKKKDKSAEIAAISLGVIGITALASSFAR